jgi:transposase
VARELGLSIPTVDKWRRRFSLFGLRGLWDQPRTGKPAQYDAHFRNRVLALLEQPPPPHLSHWDGPAIAERLEASGYAVWRVLRREGIYLQRQRSWCVSTDQQFAPKAADVIAWYLKPARQCSGFERGRKAQCAGDRTPFWLGRDGQRESGAGLKST